MTFIPHIIYADFEQTIHSEISGILLEVVCKCYRFYLSHTGEKNLPKNLITFVTLKSLGLTTFFKLFFVLSFLKPEKECFSEDLIHIKPNNQQKQNFYTFFEKNYIYKALISFHQYGLSYPT